MDEYELISMKNISTAKKIIKELKIYEIFNANNYKANLIGSVATNLLMNNLDIDFHVYPDNFNIENIYGIVGKISTNQNVIRTSCLHNDLNTEYKSLDWHIRYIDMENNEWRIDIIFFKEDSPYIGKAEDIVKKINSIVTPGQINIILKLKYEAGKLNIEFKGIEIYKAVIEYNIIRLTDFLRWKESNEFKLIDFWEINSS
jgi:hypothetical protein